MTPKVDSDIPEHVETLLQSAVLAPSSHNTQPWRFKISGEVISLYADRTRALPVNDPEDRELTISCGCALMNLRVAAAEAGLSANVKIGPNGEGDLLAAVELDGSAGSEGGEAQLFPAIAQRRTYRKRFESDPVLDSMLRTLSDEAGREGAWLKALEDEDTRHEVVQLVAEGDAIQWANPSWRRELAAWMHPSRTGDGLTVPWLAAPVAQLVVRTFDMGNGVAAKDAELAEASPVLAVLGTERDGPADWLAAGQALQRLLLNACQVGLQASYLNQPIQVASLRPKLQHTIGHSGFPQILLRLGHTGEDLPATPRRDLEQVIA